MDILITSAGSELARNIAGALAEEHTLRLTELYPVEDVQGTFVQSELGTRRVNQRTRPRHGCYYPHRRNTASPSR